MYNFYRNFQQINNKGDKRKIVQNHYYSRNSVLSWFLKSKFQKLLPMYLL